MKLKMGDYIILEYDGSVWVWGEGHINDTPTNLKVEDGSFRRFVEALAKEHGFSIAESAPDWPHCFELV